MNKVLIVEDDPTIARIYQGLLRMEGFEGELAKDGDAAIECLGRFRPNLVLLDLMLPKKNGIQVLKHIRSDEGMRELPVIVFTNAYMGSLMREALLAGATHCIAKAKSTPKQVMQTIRGFLALACSAPPDPVPGPPPQTSAGSAPANSDAAARSANASPQTDVPPVLNRALQIVAEMRPKLLALAKSEQDGGQLSHLTSLRSSLGQLTRNTLEGGYPALGQMTKALEDLCAELCGNPTKLDPCFLRAMAQSLDCIDSLIRRAVRGEGQTLKKSMALVVDDCPDSRSLIASVIENLGVRCIPLDDPARAAQLLESNGYDLIFLDADTSRLGASQLCRKLREAGPNKAAAVLLITNRTTLESRALSVMCGADDFIRRPLSQSELAVKALLQTLNPRSRPVPKPADQLRNSLPGGEKPLRLLPLDREPSLPAAAVSAKN